MSTAIRKRTSATALATDRSARVSGTRSRRTWASDIASLSHGTPYTGVNAITQTRIAAVADFSVGQVRVTDGGHHRTAPTITRVRHKNLAGADIQ
jgi:hypothetical protein